VLTIHLITTSFAFYNLANTVAWESAKKKLFITTVISRLSFQMGMDMGGNWELIDGKMGMGFKFQMLMGIGWERSHWNGRELGQKSVPAHLYSVPCMAKWQCNTYSLL